MAAAFSSRNPWFRPSLVPGLPRKQEFHQAKRVWVWFSESRHSEDYAAFLLERHFEHIERLIDLELIHDEEAVRNLPRPPRRSSRPESHGTAS